jgi:hypothetical protein
MGPNILVRFKHVLRTIKNDDVPGPAADQATAVSHQICGHFDLARCDIEGLENDGHEA